MERVYVGNLPPDIRIKDIDDFFRPFGKLVYIDVNNRSNPVYAYVQFDSAINAFNAVKSRHGYDYEGYSLQLRLVENEVRKRRDATPPPPPPLFGDYGLQNNRRGGFNQNDLGNNNMNRFPNSNISSFQTNFNSQWPNNNIKSQQQNVSQYSDNNRVNMSQQNMITYPTNNRNNMQQQNTMQYSNATRSHMPQQQFSNSNISSISQQNNLNTNRVNTFQQQNMMGYGNNNSWNGGNNINNMGWNTNNSNMSSGPRNNDVPNNYNAGNDPYARLDSNDYYTRGMSGSNRKWFNRFIRKGMTPEMARAKALEHRTVPYLREDPKFTNNDTKNVALETIGNTLLSLLSTNALDNFKSNPSPVKWTGNIEPQAKTSDPPRNRVSRNQYIKSLAILKKFKGRGVQNPQDRISKKYHTQIIKDYEQFDLAARSNVTKSSNPRNEGKIAVRDPEGKTFMELSEALTKKKQKLFLAARRLRNDPNQSFGVGYRKRMKILKNEFGFDELESKALAVHSLETLGEVMSLKAECDQAGRDIPDPLLGNKSSSANKLSKEVAYRNDIKYLRRNENYKLENLSSRLQSSLRACLIRIHKHERATHMPLSNTRFKSLLPDKNVQNKRDKKINTNNLKKSSVKNQTNTNNTNTKTNIKKIEKTKGETKNMPAAKAEGKKQEVKTEQVDKKEGREDCNEDQQNDEECEDAENEEYDDGQNLENGDNEEAE